MRTPLTALVVTGAFTSIACAGGGRPLAESHPVQCVALPGGQEYETVATQAFWGDASFMETCVPRNSPLQESLRIRILARSDGSIADLEITPDTTVAQCVRKATVSRTLPRPPRACVVQINLRFKP